MPHVTVSGCGGVRARAQDPAEAMSELGFGEVECKAAALPVHMAGSRRKLNAYLFVKRGSPTAPAGAAPAAGVGKSLSTATPFDPTQVGDWLARTAWVALVQFQPAGRLCKAPSLLRGRPVRLQVLSELTRMASNDSRAATAAKGAAAGSPASERTTCRTESAAAEADAQPQHHNHGLRPRRGSAASSGGGASGSQPAARLGLSTTGSGSWMHSGGAGNEPDLQGLVLASPGTKRSAGDAAQHEDDELVPSQASRAAGRTSRTRDGGRKPPVARALASTLVSAGSAPAAVVGKGTGQLEEEQAVSVPDVASQPDQHAAAPAPPRRSDAKAPAGVVTGAGGAKQADAGRLTSAPRTRGASQRAPK